MYHQTLIGRSLLAALRCSLLFLLGLVGSFATHNLLLKSRH